MQIGHNVHWGYFCYDLRESGTFYLQITGNWEKDCNNGYFPNTQEIFKLTNPNAKLNKDVKIAVSDFAKGRHVKGTGKSYFTGTWDELIALTKENLDKAVPGIGETDLSRKVVVPIGSVDFDKFVGTTVKLRPNMVLESKVDQRQPGEDLFVSTKVTCETYLGENKLVGSRYVSPDPVVKVEIVLYSKDALLENDGKVSSDADFEIVSINCCANLDEPLHFQTMARNFLEEYGGTKSVYSAKEFAESIFYWSSRISI